MQFPSLSIAELAAYYVSIEAEFIEIDKSSGADPREMILRLYLATRRDMLRSREERKRLEARVEVLEASALNLADAYQGSHMSGKTYARGEIVSFSGGIWLALTETAKRPGSDDSGWRLIVKAGRDGKDAGS